MSATHDADGDDLELLAQQVAYYRAIAAEYEDHYIDAPGGVRLARALDAFGVRGEVLELACGPGGWTKQLVRCPEVRSVTAVDAAPEMIARARARVGTDPRVRFVQADLFAWQPDRRYDVVLFGFFLSHVPMERFEAFWSMVAGGLAPGGRVFFADDAYRTPEELVDGDASSTIERRSNDGTRFRAVKVPHDPVALEARLRALGWEIAVHATEGPFYWGSGSLRS